MSVLRKFLLLLALVGGGSFGWAAEESPAKKVFVLPIREDIDKPLIYLVRRGVKEAMEAKADVLVIDMDTNGGRVDITEQLIEIINQFKGQTVTFVNRKAFSAGAFISFATQKIYMAPQSVIGAAAPIMLSPGGTGVETMPDTVEVKTASAISALVRANAEKNGHNAEVADAMVKKTKELKIDGKILNEKGQLLTLTNKEAEEEYGQPPKPLLSAGTVEDIDALIAKLGFAGAVRKNIEPTGAERVAFWINAISPLLLMVGVIGIYIEFKTPGFGLPGVVAIIAFAIYFLGGYVAGLSGIEWVAVFTLGLILLALEMFVFPGTLALGVAGALLMLVSLVMATVDVYPGMPAIPTLPQLQLPIANLFVAGVGAVAIAWVLSRVLPKTSLYGTLVSKSASGMESVKTREQQHTSRIGAVGKAVSNLRPGGKAQFGDDVLDVISQGDLVSKGQSVRIIGYSGTEAIVEVVG